MDSEDKQNLMARDVQGRGIEIANHLMFLTEEPGLGRL